jgi:general secretion pathway protein C
LARLAWGILPGAGTGSAPPPTATVTASGSGGGGQATDLGGLTRLHLFGEVERKPQQTRPEGPIDAPETKLNLTLRGILYNYDPEFARAIIADAKNKDEFYRIGDELPGGATLDGIYQDRVILLRNGRHEALRLPEEGLETASSDGAGSSATARRASGGGSGGETQALNRFRQELVDNPAQAQKYFQGRPFRENGEMVGFQIQPGPDPRVFEMVGLQPGDIVTQVGDVEINSPEKGFEVFDALASSNQVTITVLRDGQRQRIPVSFQ